MISTSARPGLGNPGVWSHSIRVFGGMEEPQPRTLDTEEKTLDLHLLSRRGTHYRQGVQETFSEVRFRMPPLEMSVEIKTIS